MERSILGLVVLLRVVGVSSLVGPEGFYREVFRQGFAVVI